MTPGLAAIAAGVVVALVGVIVLGMLVRRHRLTLVTAVPWLALDGYLLALWIYALAPAPDPAGIVCRAPNLVEFPNLVGVSPGARGLLADPSFQELVLNVALFLPLGVMLGVMFRRGIPSSALIGLALSLAVETTQLTGGWGLYACAYRQYSTEDVLLNTLGATAGASIAWLAHRRPWGPAYIDAESGRARSGGRRLLAIALDLATVAVGCIAAVVFYRLVLTTGLDRPFDLVNGGADTIVGIAIAVLAQAIVLLCTGMTVGEQIVDLRRRPRGRPGSDATGSVAQDAGAVHGARGPHDGEPSGAERDLQLEGRVEVGGEERDGRA